MIQVTQLTKRFDEYEAVRGVSFGVDKGEILALIGTSGSGKTTILKMLNGLVPRSSGEISIRSTSLDDTDLVHLRRSMGYVIQDVGLFPHYSVARNIGVMAELQGQKLDDQDIKKLLDRVGVAPELASAYPDQLSGGQQQRVGIARALAMDPDILLMDEPFGALDPITREQLQQEFINMPGIREKAVVLVTHDLDEAARLASRICVLDKGKIQQIGTLRELLFNPTNTFVTEFVSHHRITLEWWALTLRDILEYLPEGESGEYCPQNLTIASYLHLGLECYTHSDEYGSRKLTPELVLGSYYNNREQITTRISDG